MMASSRGAASHSELNYHLTLKIPHLFSTFLTEIFLTFGKKPLPVVFVFLFARDAPQYQSKSTAISQANALDVMQAQHGHGHPRTPPPPSYAPESKPIAFLPISLPSLLSLLISSLIMHYEYLHHNESTAGHQRSLFETRWKRICPQGRVLVF